MISDNHVRSYTNSGNSVFVTTDTFDVLDKNTASWQWKVLIPLEANERLRRNHDFAARIIFCKSDGILPTQKRCLNYVWTDSVEKGTVWVNPWNSKQINIALRDSQDGVDTWKEEKINLVEDFKKYLNIDIKRSGVEESSQMQITQDKLLRPNTRTLIFNKSFLWTPRPK